MRTKLLMISFAMLFFVVSSCNQHKNETAVSTKDSTNAAAKKPARKWVQPDSIGYRWQPAKAWIAANRQDPSFDKVLAVNRTDTANLKAMDSILVPAALNGDAALYMPFPVDVPALRSVNKLIVFSYPTQSFAAYESGQLVHAGATNMGRKKDTTPTGLFYCNWKAEETTSTFNDEWNLRWNFNIENKLGVGFHQYALPGYPASHSCLRLTATDAQYLYNWAEQWVLDPSNENIELAKGTPVIVYGAYPFGSTKPWQQLAQNPHALDISSAQLEQLVTPYLADMLAQQQKRAVVAETAQTATIH